MTRDEMISWLISNDTDYMFGKDGEEWLASVLRFGFSGYEDQPDDVLRREILDRDEEAFDREITPLIEEITNA